MDQVESTRYLCGCGCSVILVQDDHPSDTSFCMQSNGNCKTHTHTHTQRNTQGRISASFLTGSDSTIFCVSAGEHFHFTLFQSGRMWGGSKPGEWTLKPMWYKILGFPCLSFGNVILIVFVWVRYSMFRLNCFSQSLFECVKWHISRHPTLSLL